MSMAHRVVSNPVIDPLLSADHLRSDVLQHNHWPRERPVPSRRDEDLWDDVHVATADGDMDLQASTGPGDFCLEDVADFTAKVPRSFTRRAYAAGQREAAERGKTAYSRRNAVWPCHRVTGLSSFSVWGPLQFHEEKQAYYAAQRRAEAEEAGQAVAKDGVGHSRHRGWLWRRSRLFQLYAHTLLLSRCISVRVLGCGPGQ